MEAFEFDSMKTEKAKAMLRFNLVQAIWKTFRFIELCLIIILLSWASARLPFAVTISAEYLRRLITVVVSPIFVFAVSNAIVFALLFKTGQNNPPIYNAESDRLYNEIVNNGETELDLEPTREMEATITITNIVYEDKQVIVEAAKVEDKIEAPDESTKRKPYRYRRSQSEKLKNETPNTPASCKELQRSVTEIGQKQKKKTVSVVDELSNEEFQKTIEAFIAKQVKFHQEEISAIVTC